MQKLFCELLTIVFDLQLNGWQRNFLVGYFLQRGWYSNPSSWLLFTDINVWQSSEKNRFNKNFYIIIYKKPTYSKYNLKWNASSSIMCLIYQMMLSLSSLLLFLLDIFCILCLCFCVSLKSYINCIFLCLFWEQIRQFIELRNALHFKHFQ